jgi:hypothetical protein
MLEKLQAILDGTILGQSFLNEPFFDEPWKPVSRPALAVG